MAKYLLIESRDPYEWTVVREHFELGVELKQAGHEVAFYLVQNGVLPARAGASREDISEALAAQIEVFADDLSLRERGITGHGIGKGVQVASIDLVIERLAAGWNALYC